MNKSENIAKLSAALVKAQSEFKQINFDSTNPFLKNKYASLGTIIENTRAVLSKYGLSVIQPTVNENGLVGITTTILHESGEWIESTIMLPIYEEKGKSMAQVAGSVITYLRRYSLASMLNLYADEDNDGNDSQKKQPGTDQKPTEQKPVEKQTILEPQQKNERAVLTPEKLKELMASKAEKYDATGTNVTDGQRKQFLLLTKSFGDNDDNMRHEFCQYVFDDPSHMSMTPGQIMAGIDWATKNPKIARAEFRAVIDHLSGEIHENGDANLGE